MIVLSLNQVATQKGREFAKSHPYADGATAAKWAARWFDPAEAREAFLASWRKEAGLTYPT